MSVYYKFKDFFFISIFILTVSLILDLIFGTVSKYTHISSGLLICLVVLDVILKFIDKPDKKEKGYDPK